MQELLSLINRIGKANLSQDCHIEYFQSGNSFKPSLQAFGFFQMFSDTCSDAFQIYSDFFRFQATQLSSIPIFQILSDGFQICSDFFRFQATQLSSIPSFQIFSDCFQIFSDLFLFSKLLCAQTTNLPNTTFQSFQVINFPNF